MFVIPTKYTYKNNYVIQLVKDIREHHSKDEIVVVDSSSEDKSYFDEIKKYDVIVEDVNNKNWMIGAYWYAYNKYDRDFYFFMHDSMRVKANLDYLKQNELTILATFDRNAGNYNGFADFITKNTGYKKYECVGLGVYGPIFFCKKNVMDSLKKNNVDKILPNNKLETQWLERAYGFFFEQEGFDLNQCNILGDILYHESSGNTHKYLSTNWQYPIEKFYAKQSR